MNWQYLWRLAKSDYLKLLPLLGLAFYIAFIPHGNFNYQYPLHVDEWVHLARSEAMLRADSATFIEPFHGVGTVGLGSNLEAGFHVFWGVFREISGISWLTIFRYFPGVIFMIAVLSVYVLGRRKEFGWEAAFFTCLIPTTVGILGPAFLVPVAMAFVFIPLSLFLAFNFRTVWSYLALLIFTCFMLSIHAPTAVGLVIVLGPYLLLSLKGDLRHSLALALAVVIPFLVPFPWIFGLLLPTAKSLFSQVPVADYIQIPRVITTYGYLPIALCLLGTLLLAVRGGKKNYGLIFGLLALLLVLVVFFTFHYGVPIVYERGLMYLMLMLGIVAGVGLAGVRTARLPSRLLARTKPLLARSAPVILWLALIGVTLAIALPQRQNTPYYHMINQEDYEAFVWIRDNIGDEYDRAILDPWKATAFTAITGKYTYSRIHAYPLPSDFKANKFLEEGCIDTSFLRKEWISIVYTQIGCSNPNLVQVRDNVYLLER